MKLLKYIQYLRESLDFNIEDIGDLFQDFKDNYYIIDIDKEYKYSQKYKKLVYPFPGKYLTSYKITISPGSSNKNEICEDLSKNYLNIIKQLEAWGFSVVTLLNPKEIRFEDGLIYNINRGNFESQKIYNLISKIKLVIIDNSIEELTIDEWFNNLEGYTKKLEFDYQEGSVGFSNLDTDQLSQIMIKLLSRLYLNDILEFIVDYENELILPWSILDNTKDDYCYEIGDLVNDYYSDFESLIQNSTRLKSNRKMSLEEMIDYLEKNYPDLISEILEYLLELKNYKINEWVSLYFQKLLEDSLKVDVFNGGVRVYFPNIDFIEYDLDSNFCEKFEIEIINNRISQTWKNFLIKNIHFLIKEDKGFDLLDYSDFSFKNNKEIEKIINQYED
jgi:hypothetical protein